MYLFLKKILVVVVFFGIVVELLVGGRIVYLIFKIFFNIGNEYL